MKLLTFCCALMTAWLLVSVDTTRVEIMEIDPDLPGSDYINANYIRVSLFSDTQGHLSIFKPFQKKWFVAHSMAVKDLLVNYSCVCTLNLFMYVLEECFNPCQMVVLCRVRMKKGDMWMKAKSSLPPKGAYRTQSLTSGRWCIRRTPMSSLWPRRRWNEGGWAALPKYGVNVRECSPVVGQWSVTVSVDLIMR